MRTNSLLFVLALLAPMPVTAETPWYLPPASGPIIRHFEPPPTPYAAGHRGIDIQEPIGAEVRAARDGQVHFAGPVGGLLYVSLDHSDGLRTTYSYLSRVSVRTGQHVAQGEILGASGAGHPGQSPPLLHFGVLRGAEYIDPEPLLVAGLRHEPWRVIYLAPDTPAAAAG